MTAKMTNKLDLCVSAIARKFGYVSQKKAALGFAEGWYMHNERAAACWQSVEEAFANSELQDSLSENIEFRKGELTQFYFNSLPPIEKLSFSKCIEQKEGFVLVPVELTYKQAQDIAMAKIAADADIFEQEHSHTSPEVKSHIKERALTATTIAVQLNYKAMTQAAQECE